MRLTITKKILFLILLIILFLAGGGLLVSRAVMNQLASEVSASSLTMKLNGDIESFVRAVDGEYGTLRIQKGVLVSPEGLSVNTNGFIDDFTDDLGITATIFQLEGDDFIRLITNIRKEDGSRAVGTFLGKKSSAYAPVLRGERYLGEAEILGVNYLTAYDPLLDHNGTLIGILYVGIPVDEVAALAGTLSSRGLFLLSLLFTVLAVVSLAAGWRMSVKIAGPVSEGAALSARIAEGDLSGELPPHYFKRSDEVGDLARSLSFQIEKLSSIVSRVNESSERIDLQSRSFNDSARSIAEGSSNQAAAAEEVSASMEEMSANIQQNTLNAQETEEIAVRLSADAQEGGKVVTEALEAMNMIADRISIIEEIARNTNLLALNAAIEAARAGDAGRGFAVVAAEVRKLAERSQQAASEIGELSVSTVEKAGAAGEMLDHLVPEIVRTSELIREITSASREQSSGAEQINQAVMQLDTVIQDNAASSEEMANAARDLTLRAEDLKQIMSFFSTTGDNTEKKDRPLKGRSVNRSLTYTKGGTLLAG